MTTVHFSKVYSAELEGIEARLVEVETDLHVGLHAFNIIGLADKALSEAKERVNSALKNSGLKSPNKENRKIVVNLAPADLRKTGSQYDLAIAIGYLQATGQIKEFQTNDKIFIGELSLDGSLRPVSGALNFARLVKRLGFKYLFLPKVNAQEAALVTGIKIMPVENFNQLVGHLEDRKIVKAQPTTGIKRQETSNQKQGAVDFEEIKGQDNAKRALLIAAAGGHNILMMGSPGGGKTMLAQALNSILPDLTLDELIEITQIYSSAGLLKDEPFIDRRPFRSPHQTASPVAIIGGGPNPRPGEISLAHRGILFLDELPEFRRDLLESLRQPIESGQVIVSRIKNNLVFPAKFTLVAAMNPCPCGYYGDEEKECRCTANEASRYNKKISGPLMDRIDLQIIVPRVKIEALRSFSPRFDRVEAGANAPAVVKTLAGRQDDEVKSESALMRDKVLAARKVQHERLGNNRTNSEMSSKECDQLIKMDDSARNFIDTILAKSLISARGYYRILKTAQTVADLESSLVVSQSHLSEAFGYRLKEN